MACRVTSNPKLFGGAPIIMCGPGMGPTPRKKCAFCDHKGRASISLCDWPVWKQIEKRAELAEVGDVWITQQAAKRGRIVEIENLKLAPDKQGTLSYVVTEGEFQARRIWVLIPGHPKPYPYTRNNGATFTTEGPGTCDQACCFRHRRHVGIDKDYCMDHWNAWEAV
jgi:hypothetical protein